MRVVVLGAGVAGVTTAWFLARDGHEVTVIDRQPVAANETSFANAGLVSPGHAFSWASPKAPRVLLKSLFRDDTGLRLKLRADPRLWLWCLKFLRNCTSERARVNSLRKLRICAYSHDVLTALVEESEIDYHRTTGGILYLHRDPGALARAAGEMRLLAEDGVRFETLDADGVVRVEPALAAAEKGIVGAIYCPDDESGDCNLFTRELAARCAAAGVAFRYETTITAIQGSGDRIERIVTDKGDIAGDAFVMSLGSFSPIHARGLGVRLPIYPVKGYSMTIPIDGHNGAPRLSGVDETTLTAWSRLGDRLRLTSTAEISGYDRALNPTQFARMRRAAERLFPDGAAYGKATEWAGLRPQTPEGTPILGKARHGNLWFNTGHGSMGWTMGAGSGRITADLIAGRDPGIALDGS